MPAHAAHALKPCFLQRGSVPTEVFAGLSARPRTLSPRWFYDRRGSELFEAITALPEYYLTRAEHTILFTMQPRLLGSSAEVGADRAGLGLFCQNSVAPEGTRALGLCADRYLGDFLHQSAAALAKRFPALSIHPLVADFMESFYFTRAGQKSAASRLFPGSTIGNMTVPVAVESLRATARTLGEEAFLLIGIDRIKDAKRLIAAYDDAQGITARIQSQPHSPNKSRITGDDTRKGISPCRALERLRGAH